MNRYIALMAAAIPLCACEDLDQMPHVETTTTGVFTSVTNYNAALAKAYASFVIAGQEKGGGNSDLSSNTGYDYMRCYFNMQECATEEVVSTWINGDKTSDLTFMTWAPTDPWVTDTYYRIYYTIALCNEFIRNASDDNIGKFAEVDRKSITRYRNEARFLRALAYSHALDLYHDIPYVDEKGGTSFYLPERYTGQQVFDFLERELNEIAEALPLHTDSQHEYGRACREAAWALLAKIELNARVYRQEKSALMNNNLLSDAECKANYTKCVELCKKVMESGYTLNFSYGELFNASNNLRTNEIIFPLCVDATHTVSWGATTYLVCGEIDASSTMATSTYGVSSGWSMFRLRKEFSELFEGNANAKDSRAMIYKDGQDISANVVPEGHSYGYLGEKWSNLYDNGDAASNTDESGASIDYPMIRLADVMLTAAEATLRGGEGLSESEAQELVNKVRDRAGAQPATDVNLSYILDERGRELWWECTRRTDLVRYGLFTSGEYVWQWKGNTLNGQGVDGKYNIYPIPSTEIGANPNLENNY